MVDDNEIKTKTCTKVLMQLMCPCCCGGLFSESKGSVYMKRSSTIRRSERSATTICSNIEQIKNNVEATIPNTPVFSSSELMRRKQANDNLYANYKVPKMRRISLNETVSVALNQELNDNVFRNGTPWNNKLRKVSCASCGIDLNHKDKRDAMVIEMKIRGKECVIKQNGDNEPPFNFQANLRKTNTTRASLQRPAKESNIKTEVKEFDNDETVSSENCFITQELCPGVILEGTVYDI